MRVLMLSICYFHFLPAFAFMIILAIIRIAEGNDTNDRPKLADVRSLPSLFGISVYSFMCQHSLPGMITPMRSKRWVFWMLAGDFLMTFTFYLLLVITGSFAFEPCNMRELYTLDFFKPGEVVKVIMGIYLALFPVFTLSTNFPIIAVTLRENLKALFRLILKLSNSNFTLPKVINFLLFPLIALLPAVIISYATQQDDILVSITGSFPGVGVQYVIPAALVLMGRYSMIKRFGSYQNKYKSPFGHVVIVCIVFAWTVISVLLIIVKMSVNPPQVTKHPIQ